MVVESIIDDNIYQRFSHLIDAGQTTEGFKKSMQIFHDEISKNFCTTFPTISSSSYLKDDLNEFPTELTVWTNRIVRSMATPGCPQQPLETSFFREAKKEGLKNCLGVFESKVTYEPPELSENDQRQFKHLETKCPPDSQKKITNFVYALGPMFFLKVSKYVSYKTTFPYVPLCLHTLLDQAADKKMNSILRSFCALSKFKPLIYMFAKDTTSTKPFKIPHPFSKSNEYSISWRTENFLEFSSDDELSELDMCDYNELIVEYNNIQTIPTLVVILYCALRFNISSSSLPKFPAFMNKEIKEKLKSFNKNKSVMKISYKRGETDTQK